MVRMERTRGIVVIEMPKAMSSYGGYEIMYIFFHQEDEMGDLSMCSQLIILRLNLKDGFACFPSVKVLRFFFVELCFLT